MKTLSALITTMPLLGLYFQNNRNEVIFLKRLIAAHLIMRAFYAKTIGCQSSYYRLEPMFNIISMAFHN